MYIQKYLSMQKIMSRREAERYLKQGKIKVNGQIVTEFGKQIDPDKDKIEIVGVVSAKTTIMCNKPRGISSSKVKEEGKNIFDLLPQFNHLSTIGRLDKESEGLILLSNDGVLTNLITGEDHLIEKEYIVEVQEKVTPTKINALSKAMILNDGVTLPAQAKLLSDHSFSIVLKEGRNHQIRRMAAKVNLTVLKLQRIRIGTLQLGNLNTGTYRPVTKEEIQELD
jgi:pseudouridine synthase